MSEALYWSCNSETERLTHDNKDEAIEQYLDLYEPPGTGNVEEMLGELGEITVFGFAHDTLPTRESLAELALEDMFGHFCDYADPENEEEPPTQGMKDAALAFADAIIADYRVWVCKIVCEEKVNALEWVREHSPHWLNAPGEKEEKDA